MARISHRKTLRISQLWLLALVFAIAIAAIACGSDDGGSGGGGSAETFAKIASPDEAYTLESISDDLGVLFKSSKEYDVEGLDGATAAYYAFFGDDPYNRKEFEIRLYPSHQVALDTGVSFADESTGEDAVILEDVQRWDVGLKERRQCAGNGGHASGKCDNAKYGDYVVRGNMILLCQGKDTADALANCEEFMTAVETSAGAGV